jgi:hypothetical protein
VTDERELGTIADLEQRVVLLETFVMGLVGMGRIVADRQPIAEDVVLEDVSSA